MFHFRNLLLITTLCLALSSNALPVNSPRQMDEAHHNAAREVVPGIEPRDPNGTPRAAAKAPPAALPVASLHSVALPASAKAPPAASTISPLTKPLATTSKSSLVHSVATLPSAALPASKTAASSLAASIPAASPALGTSAGSATGNNTNCTLLPPTSATQAPSPVVSAKAAAKSLSKRLLVSLNRLMGRDAPEFIGFHGTNSNTATFWAQQGVIAKPPSNSGILDFLGITSTGSGTSGAAAELGPGLYVADEPIIAQGFANNNALNNPGTHPVVCAIFAISSGNWRSVIPKVFIPESLVGDSSSLTLSQQKENNRLLYIRNRGVTISTSSAATAIKFSLLDTRARTGQMVIPTAVAGHFFAKCFPAGTDIVRAFPPGTLPPLNIFQYDNPAIREAWNVAPESQSLANQILGVGPSGAGRGRGRGQC